MFKRTIATIIVAGAAFAAPVAASATPYPAPDSDLTCAAAQVAPGESFGCTITGPDGASAQLQTTFSGADAEIAGTVTSDAKTITDGEANFTVTAPTIEGVIGITALVDGVAIESTAAVDVAAELSGTGFTGVPLAVAAGALLAAGAAVVFVAARRKSSASTDA